MHQNRGPRSDSTHFSKRLPLKNPSRNANSQGKTGRAPTLAEALVGGGRKIYSVYYQPRMLYETPHFMSEEDVKTSLGKEKNQSFWVE